MLKVIIKELFLSFKTEVFSLDVKPIYLAMARWSLPVVSKTDFC